MGENACRNQQKSISKKNLRNHCEFKAAKGWNKKYPQRNQRNLKRDWLINCGD